MQEKKEYPFDVDQVNALIRQRRSVYPSQYSSEVIEDEIIEQLLENANWAPTHGKTEPWRFQVFTGEGLKKLANFQADLYQKLNKGEDFQEVKYDKLKANPLKASHIIAIMMKRQKSQRIPEVEEIEAVACAVQNMYLSATAYGIGAYWSSGFVTYKEEAKAFFGLEPEDKLLGFFYLGKIAKASPEGQRKAIQEKVRWIR